MIVGVGIDSVDVHRFERWCSFSEQQLLRIFSEHELSYCRENALLMPERLAVRFAAKEAFLKAYVQATGGKVVLLTVCRAVCVIRGTTGVPMLKVDWKVLDQSQEFEVLISMTHTDTLATAVVILQKADVSR